VIVLEHDGGVYACDHFVDSDHLLGNLAEHPLAALAADPRLRAFGLDKRERLPAACHRCDVLAWCHGGCPKDRIVPKAGELLNYLCPAYRRFFRHCRPAMARLAAHWRAGLPLRDFAKLPPAKRPTRHGSVR
jgi:uncharacterized protein